LIRSKVRRRAIIGVCLVSIVALFAIAPSALAKPGKYVALGDSYAAGSLNFPQDTTSVSAFCLQFAKNYPKLVQQSLGYASFQDETCGGAQVKDMTAPQTLFGTGNISSPVDAEMNGAQFDALTSDTKLVTLTIGGNDIGFIQIALSCVSLLPLGTPCKNSYVKNGVDSLKQRIDAAQPSIEGTLAAIKARSPQAKVAITGYPAILPSKNGCYPVIPVTPGDATYLNTVELNLNALIKRAATAKGAKYVDLYGPSVGHDACKPIGTRWIEPVMPIGSLAFLHPNALGESKMAEIVLPAVQ
jgi:lysophospholipase L1-like esterase